jgi:hypothetical protein
MPRINRRKQARRGQGLTSNEALELLLAWPCVSKSEARELLASFWVSAPPGYSERLHAEYEAWRQHGARFGSPREFEQWYRTECVSVADSSAKGDQR